jgi:hypothetical protein
LQYIVHVNKHLVVYFLFYVTALGRKVAFLNIYKQFEK